MDNEISYASFLTLEYVDCLARERAFSKAAQELFISQSALSQHILSLEKKLRVRLFDRGSKPLTLTKEGEVFVEGARAILLARDALWRTMSDFADYRRGTILLGMTPVRGLRMVPELLTCFATLYPNIQLSSKEASSPELEAMVLRDALDLAILQFSHEIPDLSYTTLYMEKVHLYAPPGFTPTNPRDLASILCELSPMSLILLSSHTQFDIYIRKSLLLNVPIKPRIIEVSNYLVALGLVAKGMGVAFAPEYPFSAEKSSEHLVRLPVELEGGIRRIVMVHRKRKYLSRAMVDLMTTIKEMMLTREK